MNSIFRLASRPADATSDVANPPVPEPGLGQVRLRIEVRYDKAIDGTSDLLTDVEQRTESTLKRKVVGVIDAIGPDVADWAVGQRVAAGFGAGLISRTATSRTTDFAASLVRCADGQDQIPSAWLMVEDASLLLRIPDPFREMDAAPLLEICTAAFDAIRGSIAREGELVAVIGMCGVGCLAVQLACLLKLRVAAISSGSNRASLARRLGAHHVLDAQVADVSAALATLGGATLMVATAANRAALPSLVGGLRRRGRLIVIRACDPPVEMSSSALSRPALTRPDAPKCELVEDERFSDAWAAHVAGTISLS